MGIVNPYLEKAEMDKGKTDELYESFLRKVEVYGKEWHNRKNVYSYWWGYEYEDYVLITKIFCELFGSDTMLETYSKNDISILKNSMLELNPNELECENLLSFIGSLDIEMTLQDKE